MPTLSGCTPTTTTAGTPLSRANHPPAASLTSRVSTPRPSTRPSPRRAKSSSARARGLLTAHGCSRYATRNVTNRKRSWSRAAGAWRRAHRTYATPPPRRAPNSSRTIWRSSPSATVHGPGPGYHPAPSTWRHHRAAGPSSSNCPAPCRPAQPGTCAAGRAGHSHLPVICGAGQSTAPLAVMFELGCNPD